MRPSFPTPQCLRPKCPVSRFLPHTRHNRRILQVKLPYRPGGVLTSLWQIQGDLLSPIQVELLVLQMVRRIAVRKLFSHQTRDLECFAESSDTPWSPPTIHCPDLIATVQQTFLLLLFVPLFQQYHLSLYGEVLTYNDTRIGLHKLCHILWNCQCKWLSVSSLAPETSLGSSGSPKKFLFCTDRIVSTVLPNLVPRVIGSRFSSFTKIFVICCYQSPKKFCPKYGCASAFSAGSPCYLGLHADVAVSVFREVSLKYCAYPIPLFSAALKLTHEKNSSVRPSVLGLFLSTRFSLNSSDHSGRSRNRSSHTGSVSSFCLFFRFLLVLATFLAVLGCSYSHFVLFLDAM